MSLSIREVTRKVHDGYTNDHFDKAREDVFAVLTKLPANGPPKQGLCKLDRQSMETSL